MKPRTTLAAGDNWHLYREKSDFGETAYVVVSITPLFFTANAGTENMAWQPHYAITTELPEDLIEAIALIHANRTAPKEAASG